MNRSSVWAVAALMGLGCNALADQLLERGSFEWPRVKARLERSKGGDLKKSAMNADWTIFKDKSDPAGGRLVLGLTNEIARTGKQSIVVHFDKLTKTEAVAMLASDLIPILPEQPYRIGIYGRVDKKDPVALDTRTPFIKLRIDWFKDSVDEDTGEPGYDQVEDPEFRMQPIPGSQNRPALFTATAWNQFFTDLRSPAGAQYVKVTWTWETGTKEGETNGIIFFDDATIEGPSGPKSDPFQDDPELKAIMDEAAKDPNLVQPEPDDAPLTATPLSPKGPQPAPTPQLPPPPAPKPAPAPQQ